MNKYTAQRLHFRAKTVFLENPLCIFRHVAVVWEGVFVLIRIFLNSGKYCECQRRQPLGVSWGNCSPRKFWNTGNAIFSSLHVNISKSIKSEITGIFSHNNISVWLGTFTQWYIPAKYTKRFTKLEVCFKVSRNKSLSPATRLCSVRTWYAS